MLHPPLAHRISRATARGGGVPCPQSVTPPSLRRRDERGFSLIVVFALMAIMAAMAASVLLSGRSDIQVAGRQRESTVSFFTAEAGIAYAKVYLSQQWNSTTYWTSVLTEAPRTETYDIGGITLGGGQTLPVLRTRYTYRFRNNADDPSMNPLVDTDGKVIIQSLGEALDDTGLIVIARTTVDVEVQYGSPTLLKGNYQAQANMSAAGTAGTSDINPVEMTKSTSF